MRTLFTDPAGDGEQAFFVTNDGQEIEPSKILEFIEQIAEITNGALLNKMGAGDSGSTASEQQERCTSPRWG